jgi:hypothetical protein
VQAGVTDLRQIFVANIRDRSHLDLSGAAPPVTDCSHSEFPFGTLQVSLDSIGLAGKNFDRHCHI